MNSQSCLLVSPFALSTDDASSKFSNFDRERYGIDGFSRSQDLISQSQNH